MSSFTHRQQETLGKILKAWGQAQVEPLQRRITELEMRDLDNPMSAAEYRAFCERVRAPLRLGVWSPANSSWRGRQ